MKKTSQSTKKLLVAAGGTGGHLYPALAVAEHLMEASAGAWEASFVGTERRIEGRVIPSKGYPFYPIQLSGLKGISLQTLLFPFRLAKSIVRCIGIMRLVEPDVVVCAGAYLSYPVGIAAKLQGVPLVLMESNVRPGKALAALSRHAAAICTSFPESHSFFQSNLADIIHCTGNPVREELTKLPPTAEARQKLGFPPERTLFLFFGGSLGAATIVKAAQAFAATQYGQSVSILLQTGASNSFSHNDLSPNIKVMEYIDDMSLAYSAADVVVCRAGATSLAELSITQKPAVLVPFPHAADDHQTKNAKALEKAGAAIHVSDDLAPATLPTLLPRLAEDNDRLEAMKHALRKLSRPQATLHIAQIIQNLVKVDEK